MLCTNCSTTVLPVVAIDIDGTLADYHSHFIEFAEGYFGMYFDDTGYRGDKEMHEWMRIDLGEYRQCKLAYRQGGMKRSMPLFPLAAHFMHWLHTLPVEVWITTTRPYLRLDNVDPDTRFWLERHKLHYNHLLFHDDKYQVLAESVDCDRVLAIVDDLPSQITAAQRWFPESVLYMPKRVHNQAWHNYPYIFKDFDTLRIKISLRLEKWNARYT